MIRQVALWLIRQIGLAFLKRLELWLDPCSAQTAAEYEAKKRQVEIQQAKDKAEIEELEGQLASAAIQREELQYQVAAEQAAIEKLNETLRRIQDDKADKLSRIGALSDGDALRSADL